MAAELTTNDEAAIDPGTVRSRLGEPTWELARMYPRQGEWTEEAYLRIVDLVDDRVELVDGCLEFLPMGNLLHALLVDFLLDAVKSHCRLVGAPFRAVTAPTPAKLSDRQFRDPDVSVLRLESLVGDRRRQPTAADILLVVEIVSPGDDARERDYETKRRVYAESGIAEYWIVDPDEHRVTVLSLDHGVYRVRGEFERGTQATSGVLPNFAVDVSAMFSDAEGEP